MIAQIKVSLLVIIFVMAGCGGSTSTNTTPKYASLKIISSIPSTSENVASVQISKSIAYVAYGYDGVRIFDVSDLGKPQQVGYINPYGTTSDSPDNISNIVISGNIACIALTPGCSGLCMGSLESGVLRFYDISDPKNPVFISSLDESSADFLTDGNFLYVSRYSSSSTSFAQLDVIDISAPLVPKIVGSTPIPAAGHLAKSGNLVFISYNDLTHFKSIQAVDVSNPNSPAALGSNENGAINVAHAYLAMHGNIAYIADGDFGIPVVNVSNPISPTVITTITSAAVTTSLFSSGSYLYSASGSAGVGIYDLQSPQNPVLIQSIQTGNPALRIWIYDGIGIVLTDQAGTQKEMLNFFLTGTSL